jgi:hypothetical protein
MTVNKWTTTTQYNVSCKFIIKPWASYELKKYSPREGIKEPSPLGVGKGNSHA